MNAWALGAPPAQVARRHRTSEQKGGLDNELWKIVSKLCLKNSLEIRELQAATLVTYLVPKENELVQATMDATKAHADSVEEANKISNERERQSKLELVGAVHAHRWAAVVRMAGA